MRQDARFLSADQHSLILLVDQLIRTRFVEARGAASRLLTELDPKTHWRREVIRYREGYRAARQVLKHQGFKRDQWRHEAQMSRPDRAAFCSPEHEATRRLARWTWLGTWTRRLLAENSERPHGYPVSVAWDLALAFWLLYRPDAALPELGDINVWDQEGVGRKHVMEEVLHVTSHEAVFERARAAVTVIQAETPEVQLFHALNAMHGYANIHLFREVAKHRKSMADLRLRMLNVLGKSDPEAAMKRMHEPPGDNIAPEFYKTLDNVATDWIAFCDRAESAISAGGSQDLDETKNPGKREASMSLIVRIIQARRNMESLRRGLRIPGSEIDGLIEQLEKDTAYAGEMRDHIRAIWSLKRPAPSGTQGERRESTSGAPPTPPSAAAPTKPVLTEVVLWEGAEYSKRNLRLARTRSAYLECHGNVPAAMKVLEDSGNRVSRRTFYNHLDALDEAIPRWRESVQLCNPPAQMHGMRTVGTRGKPWGKSR